MVVLCALVTSAEARPVTAVWDRNADPYTVGYRIYVGTAPGVYGLQFDVGNVTSYRFEVPDLPRLYFVVRAYNAAGQLSPSSNEVMIGTANRPPTLYNPGDLIVPAGPISGRLPAHDPDGDPLTFSASGLPSSLSINPATGVVSGYLASGVYTVTITASDGQDLSEVTFRLTVAGGGNCQGPPTRPTLQQAAVAGNQVRLTWSSSTSGNQPLTYVLQAGTASGRSDIAVAELPASITTIAPTAPNGLYFVRVAGRNSCGTTVSNEIGFRVGPPPPGAPSLRFQRSGSAVTLSWTAPAGGASAYVVEAGTASGLSNLAVVNTGSPLTSYTFNLPTGRYFIRVRAVNASGPGAASNEVAISVP